ncbi:winged helix-turn-helix transcriptional regulator [Exiguobacterium sp. SL14]|nr:sigma factor-like helix-turn-helix DNA-binding protein [Exiguobacterium sp. SL14]MCY1690034.1 winged helix-turn-helix transcriptional regulator [Exiguobacterium sp. SL14]
MTQQQISERLDLPLGTVKTRIRSAIQALRKRMDGRERDGRTLS